MCIKQVFIYLKLMQTKPQGTISIIIFHVKIGTEEISQKRNDTSLGRHP